MCLEMYFLSGSTVSLTALTHTFKWYYLQDFSVLSQFIPYSYMYPKSQHGVFSQVCQCLTDVVGVVVGMKRAYNTESSLGSSNLTLEMALGPLRTAIVHGNTSGGPNFKNGNMNFINAGTELSICTNCRDAGTMGECRFPDACVIATMIP